MCLFFLSWK